MPYRKVALGGTFDHLHLGHEQLLTTALAVADEIMVGVTVDALVASKAYAHLIEPFDLRFDAVSRWLHLHRSGQAVEVVPLADIFGPTLTNSTIEALAVTAQTKDGAVIINTHRQKRGMSKLPVIEAAMIRDETGEYISSTRIRQGIVSRNGSVYASLFQKDVIFPTSILAGLSQLQGNLMQAADLKIDHLNQFSAIALIGDMVTKTFIDAGLSFTYAVTDGKTKRDYPVHLSADITVPLSNHPGTINKDLINYLYRHVPTLPKKSVIRIFGEEDLLAFLPILSLPLQSAVFYGQPGQGIGMIAVTEETKLRYARLINKSFT